MLSDIESTFNLKDAIRKFWNFEPCGSRYLDNAHDFESQARARYELEPYIPNFAQFQLSRGLRVLEIGTGIGADYLEWLKAGAIASGIDLSAHSIAKARQRCEAAGYQSDLQVSDAENLPFSDAIFDIVYSYGVMHHSPDTQRCIQEAIRVLKPGGTLKIMLYHHPSLTGIMLWLRYGLFRAKSLRQALYHHLESPGTKTYTRNEIRAMLNQLEDISIEQVFSPGDLLLTRPSRRFRSWIYRLAWRIYPRTLVRIFGRRWGLFLLISGRKPSLS